MGRDAEQKLQTRRSRVDVLHFTLPETIETLSLQARHWTCDASSQDGAGQEACR